MAKKIEIKKSAPQAAPTTRRETAAPASFAFGKDNYIFMLAGVIVLVIGYVLMVGGGSDTPETFNPAIFDTQRVTIAPVTLLIGFGIVLFGIMKKPKTQE
ncbi:MAG: DUF3098 domain-containing protein [Bacteroidota bacterium]|nr:DUF3098 domain-containing protein [Bacteroidota bacterium]